jgi:hypothetical protein
MSESKEKVKLCDVKPETRVYVIEVLKAGLLFKDMLSDFERRFVLESCGRYAAYGDKMVIAGEQWTVYLEIGHKLNLKPTEG